MPNRNAIKLNRRQLLAGAAAATSVLGAPAIVARAGRGP